MKAKPSDSRRLRRRGDTLRRLGDVVERAGPCRRSHPRSSSRRGRSRRPASPFRRQRTAAWPNPFSRSAETGRSTAATTARACASASSRRTWPSRRPSVPAKAPLDVASAGKPRPARMRAEPASQGLGITNAPGPWCRARKRSALSLWLKLMKLLLTSMPDHRGRRSSPEARTSRGLPPAALSRTNYPAKSSRSRMTGQQTVTVYFDYKSPYSYLAKDLVYELEREFPVRIDWLPYTLDIPSFRLGAGQRRGARRRGAAQCAPMVRVRYSYMDCRRQARKRGLVIRGPQKIWTRRRPHAGCYLPSARATPCCGATTMLSSSVSGSASSNRGSRCDQRGIE